MKISKAVSDYARSAYGEMDAHLKDGILKFWMAKGIDWEYGGYLTCFDGEGIPWELTDKYIVTQTRMIWGLSQFSRVYAGDLRIRTALKQGVDFFLKHFWDSENGGFVWRVKRDGGVLDAGKVVYGQAFAIYALSQYGLSTGDPAGQEYAEKTFDLLQKYSADTLRGGYYENLEEDWTVSESGFAAGDRKSLDIHMHLMEAFTTLYQLTGREIHRRKLMEVIDLIFGKMVNHEQHCGLNQFDLDFHSIPAINIRRTWNAERPAGDVLKQPLDTTSYGHNMELLWLVNRAAEVLGLPQDYFDLKTQGLADHALRFGVDYAAGGIYRDGPHTGEPFVKDKEWWQNCEALVGFLDAYLHFGDEKYFEAFRLIWEFDKKYMIKGDQGEWRQLVKQNGEPICSDLGNPWKAIYHTGRAMHESMIRLKKLT